MKCPYCEQNDTRVVDTRSAGDSIRRRRECNLCGRRFTTYERVSPSLHIVKSDGRRDPYDRNKLAEGIRIACAKRPIPMGEIDRLVTQIEESLFSRGKAEISTKVVGSTALEHLRALDGVGYIRFASVYLELDDLEAVRVEIDRLLRESKG